MCTQALDMSVSQGTLQDASFCMTDGSVHKTNWSTQQFYISAAFFTHSLQIIIGSWSLKNCSHRVLNLWQFLHTTQQQTQEKRDNRNHVKRIPVNTRFFHLQPFKKLVKCAALSHIKVCCYTSIEYVFNRIITYIH